MRNTNGNAAFTLECHYERNETNTNKETRRTKTTLNKNKYLQLSARIEFLERVDRLLAMYHGGKTISLLQ